MPIRGANVDAMRGCARRNGPTLNPLAIDCDNISDSQWIHNVSVDERDQSKGTNVACVCLMASSIPGP
jgi:hypothetical protein